MPYSIQLTIKLLFVHSIFLQIIHHIFVFEIVVNIFLLFLFTDFQWHGLGLFFYYPDPLMEILHLFRHRKRFRRPLKRTHLNEFGTYGLIRLLSQFLSNYCWIFFFRTIFFRIFIDSLLLGVFAWIYDCGPLSF